MIDEKTLRRMYWIEKKTTYQIAEEIGCSQSHVLRLMQKYDIPRRSQSELASLQLKRWWKTADEKAKRRRIIHSVQKIPFKCAPARFNRQLTDFELGYLAALLDGEGSVELTVSHRHKPKNSVSVGPRVVFYNTNKTLIENAQRMIGGKILVEEVDPTKWKKRLIINRKKFYKLDLRRLRDVYNLLTQLYPFLIVKKDRAKLVISFIKSRLKQKTLAYSLEEIKIINQFRKLIGRQPIEGMFWLKK